jgi:hypothetical protein
MNKKELLKIIVNVASADEGFLMNDCDGIDLMMNAVNKDLLKKNKQELQALYEVAKESQYFEEANEEE